MTYLTKLPNGKAAIGFFTSNNPNAPFFFQPERTFDSVEDAEDYLSEHSIEYRTYHPYTYLVRPNFALDLCRKADSVRKLRDELGKKAGISIAYHSFYQNSLYLQTYGKCDIIGNQDNTSIEARQFWAHKNYLDGIADAVYELGFVLCYDTVEKCHQLCGHGAQAAITFPEPY